MTPFFCYIFVKTDMSGVEQIGLSNREHFAADQNLIDAWRTFCV